ncbi:MAG: hypothetical protein GDA39_04160 [Hyphomonadaceae bacterium]|nr:hypothetical protein [Hyphomonadaceae bacterium]MBC6412129.1 hypothetical protein [Hyphomonadaceae bacterium]
MIIIHADMHKTGLSSIRKTLAGLNRLSTSKAGYLFGRDEEVNCKSVFVLLFHCFPETRNRTLLNGTVISHENKRKFADTWRERFEQVLKCLRSGQCDPISACGM